MTMIRSKKKVIVFLIKITLEPRQSQHALPSVSARRKSIIEIKAKDLDPSV